MYRPLRPSKGRLAEYLLFLFTAAAFMSVGIGLLTTLAGLLKAAMTSPFLLVIGCLAIMASMVALGVWICTRSMKRWTDNQILTGMTLLWIASRAVVILAFPTYTPWGDELYFRRVVLALADHGLTAASLNGLSASYDYPVWVSRALPLYLPVRLLFGAFDMAAIRAIQTLLGAGTLALTFLIARRLAGSCCARVAAWLLTIFPYHLPGVLSYDPQIPGTFLFLAGVYLAIVAIRGGNGTRGVTYAGMGAVFGACLFLAGVQRGGIDLLLFTVALAAASLYRIASAKGRPVRAVGVFFAIAAVVWMPSRYATARWIAANDVHHLRSHALGFMTRGWNLVTMGEYLRRYEALDIASPAADKKRVLTAVLITEFARQPLALAVVPAAKIGKFFLLGYASPSQTGLVTGGYSKSAQVSKACTVAFAPLMLMLCGVGLLRALRSAWLRSRLLIPVLLLTGSVAAITILWETAPRYSPPVHFALAILAAIGALELRKGWARWATFRGAGRRLVASAGFLGAVWLLLCCVVFAVASHARSFTFVDLRACRAELSGAVMRIGALHPLTTAWEGTIEIPGGTPLPAEVRLSVPAPAGYKNGRMAISLWLPDPPGDPCASCRVIVRGADEAPYVQDLARMKRFDAAAGPGNGKDRIVEITIDAREKRTPAPILLAFGYILPD